jgi:hypothetical protein
MTTEGETMDHKNKFAAESIQQLQHSLEDVAPHQATELSKQQAVRALSPQIVALRGKGYSWTAVAAMLSERGVPISVAALRTYLRRVRKEAESEAPRAAAKRSRDVRAVAHTPEPPAIAAAPSPSPVAKPATKVGTPEGTAATTGAAPPSAPVVPRREQELRRGAVVVRPDREDI